jgi:hypothetical protein
MPALHAKPPLLVVVNARHSPSYGCALRLDRGRFGAPFGHGLIELDLSIEEWLRAVEQAGIVRFLPVTHRIGAAAVALPEHHKDPQDRLIIATAMQFNARLLSFDGQFSLYRELDGLLLPNNV